MDIVDTKVLVACLFGLVSFFFGVLPIKIYRCLQLKDGVEEIDEKRRGQIRCGLALFQAFSGGVIFATCFLHMMPEVYESTIQLKKFGMIQSHYPFSQLIVSLGFFLVYFIEELAQYCISMASDTKSICEKKHENNSARSNKVIPEVQDQISVVEDMTKTPFDDDSDEDIDVEKENAINENNADETEELTQVEELNKLMDFKSLSQRQIIRGILIVLALSLHAFFEGLAIGMQTSIGNIWYLFIAVSIHSATVLFVIGLELLYVKAHLRTIIAHVVILSITSPLGVFLGLLITFRTDTNNKNKSLAVTFLEGLSAGTILYITFFEVLNREKERRVYRLRRAVFIILGFGLMACLEMAEIYD